MRIILATNNQGKVNELKSKINREIYSLKDLEINIDIIEDKDTLEGNAKLKAEAIAKIFPNDIIIADDTGLFVKSLNNEPGVYSARYAGENCNSEDNIDKLLNNLKNIDDRSAYFETVIVVYKDGIYYNYFGKLEGKILKKRSGSDGFGYDSVFYSEIYNKSLAEVSKEEKNIISHRAKAIDRLLSDNIL